MVSQTIDAPVEADPIPAEEQETEVTPDPVVEETPTETEGDAAPAEEVAVEEPNVETTAEERRYTEAELEERANQRAAQQLEWERRQRQAEGARRAAQEKREQAEREELTDLVQLGIQRGDEPEAISKLLDRYTAKRQDQMFSRAESELDTALQYIAAPILGNEPPLLSQEAVRLAEKLSPVLQQVLDRVAPALQGQLAEGYVAKADIPKLVDAEIARRNAKAREGKPPLKRLDGAASVDTNSLEYWERRVAHEGEDGVPDMSSADWAAYKTLRRQHGLS